MRKIIGVRICTRRNDIEKFCCEDVIFHLSELPHNLNFSNNLLAVQYIAEYVLNELDGNNGAILLLLGEYDSAKGSLTDLLDNVIVWRDIVPN